MNVKVMKRIYLSYDLPIFYDLNSFKMWLLLLYVVSSAPGVFLPNGVSSLLLIFSENDIYI